MREFFRSNREQKSEDRQWGACEPQKIAIDESIKYARNG